MPNIDLLVMGGSGFIGGRTAQAAQAAGLQAACTVLRRPAPPGVPAFQLDCGNADQLDACLQATRPRAIIYSVVSGNFGSNNEADHQYASLTALQVLIDSLRRVGLGSRLVYLSTNAVFSGKDGPYREDDLPDPDARQDAYRSYGLWRRAGELFALEQWPNGMVARTANVDGRDAWGQINPRLQNLIHPLRMRQPIARYVDRYLSPTLVDNLAEALVEVVAPGFALPHGRVLHLAGRDALSDYAFARRLAQKLGVDEKLVSEDHLLPPGSDSRYSIALNTTYTQSLLHTCLMGVDDLLECVLRDQHAADGPITN